MRDATVIVSSLNATLHFLDNVKVILEKVILDILQVYMGITTINKPGPFTADIN